MIRCTAYRKRDLYMTNCRASLAFLPDAMQRKKATFSKAFEIQFLLFLCAQRFAKTKTIKLCTLNSVDFLTGVA